MDFLVENLKTLRKRWRVNQVEFADLIGVHRSSYARVEASGQPLKLESALLLSKISGYSIEDFLTKKFREEDFPFAPIGEQKELVLREPSNDPGPLTEGMGELSDFTKLVEAVKELQRENRKLKERVVFLENKEREREKAVDGKV